MSGSVKIWEDQTTNCRLTPEPLRVSLSRIQVAYERYITGMDGSYQGVFCEYVTYLHYIQVTLEDLRKVMHCDKISLASNIWIFYDLWLYFVRSQHTCNIWLFLLSVDHIYLVVFTVSSLCIRLHGKTFNIARNMILQSQQMSGLFRFVQSTSFAFNNKSEHKWLQLVL